MDTLYALLEIALSSPWLYALIVVVVMIDAMFPVVPGETVVITAGAFVISGSPEVVPIVIAATAGALVGDFCCHMIGRSSGPLARRLRGNRVGNAMFEWARNGLHRRGGMIIIAARFIPGGRTATTFTSGVVGYPRPRFLFFSGIAAIAWASYNTGIGVLGGAAFQDRPLIGVVVGIGLAFAVGALIELIRKLRDRRAAASPASEWPDAADAEPAPPTAVSTADSRC